MIDAFAISKYFGRTCAVRNVSFTLEPGQITGLLGPNGAGKSTTIRMVTGFLAPDRGHVSIAGCDTIDQPNQARRVVGYLPEASPCYPEMRAIDYLVYRARLNGLKRRDARQAAAQAAERCHLEPHMARRRVGALSKGYRQRVGLAASIVHNPQVLVLDEPTNGLDPAQIRDARNLIRDLAENRSMLVSSHILPEIERTCDRVLIMVGGQIRADGSPAELASRLPTRMRIEYRPHADADPLPAIIEHVCGVESVTAGPTVDGWRTLFMDASHTAREEIASEVLKTQTIVRLFASSPPTLEDVFVHLTETTNTNGETP